MQVGTYTKVQTTLQPPSCSAHAPYNSVQRFAKTRFQLQQQTAEQRVFQHLSLRLAAAACHAQLNATTSRHSKGDAAAVVILERKLLLRCSPCTY
jgi:hypothetical protein